MADGSINASRAFTIPQTRDGSESVKMGIESVILVINKLPDGGSRFSG